MSQNERMRRLLDENENRVRLLTWESETRVPALLEENEAIEMEQKALLKQIETGRVDSAVVSVGMCAFRLRSGQTLRTQFLPGDAQFLVKLLHKHGVTFRAQGPAGWRSALVLMLPFRPRTCSHTAPQAPPAFV